MSAPFSYEAFAECARRIADAGRELAALGWTPATSSNFSMRLDEGHVAITVSGRDKGKLVPADVMVVDLDGQPVATRLKPSAETLLHTQLYRRWPDLGAVLHTHSLQQTLASKLWAPDGRVVLRDYELLKAFAGVRTHETELTVPVFANSQDMPALVREVDAHLDANPDCQGYLIDGHGIYTWGADIVEARRHLDAFEFLLSCEMALQQLRR
jgi:methylthioribulose-1-phosphate dehydratase